MGIFIVEKVEAYISTWENEFGNNGYIITDVLEPVENGYDIAHDIAVQSDGKYIQVGHTEDQFGNWILFVIRYNTDGTLDSTFANNGKLLFSTEYNNESAETISVLEDGRIMVGGHIGNEIGTDGLIIVLNSNGTLDTNFGDNGIWRINREGIDTSKIRKIMVGDTGEIIIAGDINYITPENTRMFLCKLSFEGNYLTEFGENGCFIANEFTEFKDVNFYNNQYIILSQGQSMVYDPRRDLWRAVSSLNIYTLDIDGVQLEEITKMNNLTGESIDIDMEGNIIGTYLGGGFMTIPYSGIYKVGIDGQTDPDFVDNSWEWSEEYSYTWDSIIKVLPDNNYLFLFNDIRTDALVKLCKLDSNGALIETFGENGCDSLEIPDYSYGYGGISLKLGINNEYVISLTFEDYDYNADIGLMIYLEGYQVINNDNIMFVDKNNELVNFGAIDGINFDGFVYITDNNGIIISKVEVYFTSDVNWENVVAGIDLVNKKSFVWGLVSAEGIVGTHELYIPKGTDDKKLLICPDASNIDEVYEGCPNMYELIEANENVRIEDINGTSYWIVSGLSGTGGMSYEEIELEDNSTEGETLTQTGSNVLYIWLLLLCFSFLGTAKVMDKKDSY